MFPAVRIWHLMKRCTLQGEEGGKLMGSNPTALNRTQTNFYICVMEKLCYMELGP